MFRIVIDLCRLNFPFSFTHDGNYYPISLINEPWAGRDKTPPAMYGPSNGGQGDGDEV